MYANVPVEMRPIGGMYGCGRELARKQYYIYQNIMKSMITQRRYLLSLDDSGLTGSPLEINYYKMLLLYSCMTDAMYESSYEVGKRIVILLLSGNYN
jgi:hypothetical protein